MTEGEFKLVVEELAAVGGWDGIYRLYVEANDPTDKFSAVYGNDQQPLVLTTPAGIFEQFIQHKLECFRTQSSVFANFS